MALTKKEHTALYYKRHREQVLKRTREYAEKNKAKRKATRARYYIAHAKEINEKVMQRRKTLDDVQYASRQAAYYRTHKAQIRARIYGLSAERFITILTRQQNACAICRVPFTENGHGGPHIDHDHNTGRVRGILCVRCNGGLGMFADSPDRVMAAFNYLTLPDEALSTLEEQEQE